MQGSPPHTSGLTTIRFKSFRYAVSVIGNHFNLLSNEVHWIEPDALLTISTQLSSHRSRLALEALRQIARRADDRRATRQLPFATRPCRGRGLCALQSDHSRKLRRETCRRDRPLRQFSCR